MFPDVWAASWIWAPDSGVDPGLPRRVVALRRSVAVANRPESVPARVHANARYALWVNGMEVSRGPVRASTRRQRYDVVDLAPFVHRGLNELAVLAWCYGQAMPWWAPVPGVRTDLARGGFVLEAPGLVLTDGAWSARHLEGWGMTEPAGVLGRGIERIDLLELPSDWTTAAFDGWPYAVHREPFAPGRSERHRPPSYPIGPVGPRATSAPSLVEVALVEAPPGVWRAPNGLVTGTVRVQGDGEVSAQVVERIVAGEPRPTEHDAGFAMVLDGAGETLDLYGLSALTIQGVAKAVTVVERLHPVTGGAAFECDDALLNLVWRAGRRTVTLCSPDAYVDCPTREQRAWVGDAVVHQVVDLTTNGDWSLARAYPLMTASPYSDGILPMAVASDAESGERLVIPDWSLHWVHAVWNLYRYVGDTEEIARLLPTAEQVLRWFEQFVRTDGLIGELPAEILIDWAAVGTDPPCASLNGLWGRALTEFAEISRWLGDNHRATWAEQLHARLVIGFESLWDEAAGGYVDCPTPSRRTLSQHAQAAAIVGNVAPRERWPRLVHLMTDETRLVHATHAVPDGPTLPGSEADGSAFLTHGRSDPWWDTDHDVVRAQPFFRYVVHDALAQAGFADLLPKLCRDWQWLLDRCATTLSETWYGGTVCHGWSATPTRDLMVYVLGVSPAEPGFTRARIDPHLGDLSFSNGTVPTPFGEIVIELTASRLVIASPVPFVYEGRDYEPGTHTIERGGEDRARHRP